jgi:AcrR family transcriptional regulator
MSRQSIEDAALRLFAERTIPEVSVRDIAQAAGLQVSSLYRHMQSKEELAARVFKQAYASLAGEIETALAEAADFGSQIDRVVETALALFDRDPILCRFLLLRQHDGLPAFDDSEDNPVAVLRSAVVSALNMGEIDPMDPDLATAILLGLILQPLTFVLYGRLPRPAAALAPILSLTIKRALGVHTPELHS